MSEGSVQYNPPPTQTPAQKEGVEKLMIGGPPGLLQGSRAARVCSYLRLLALKHPDLTARLFIVRCSVLSVILIAL